MDMKEELKTWQTQSSKNKVCFYLITRGIAFCYTEKSGIVFEAVRFLRETHVRRSGDSLRLLPATDHQ